MSCRHSILFREYNQPSELGRDLEDSGQTSSGLLERWAKIHGWGGRGQGRRGGNPSFPHMEALT